MKVVWYPGMDFEIDGDERIFNPLRLRVNNIEISGNVSDLSVNYCVENISALYNSEVMRMSARNNSEIGYISALNSTIENMSTFHNSKIGAIYLMNSNVRWMSTFHNSKIGAIYLMNSKDTWMNASGNSEIRDIILHNSEVWSMDVEDNSKVKNIIVEDNSKLRRILIEKDAKVNVIRVDPTATINKFIIKGHLDKFEGGWFNYNGKLEDSVLDKRKKPQREIYNILEGNDTFKGLVNAALSWSDI